MNNIDFSELKIFTPTKEENKSFIARDGEKLFFGLVSQKSDVCFIFIHGSSARYEYLLDFSRNISNKLGISVCTPTLRGHGDNPKKRGGIDYQYQLEDDMIDLLNYLSSIGYRHYIIGGHSSGGGFAARLLSSSYFAKNNFNILCGVLCAPMLGPFAASSRSDSGGWAKPILPIMFANIFLNRIGIHWLDNFVAIRFAVPEGKFDGFTKEYTYSLYGGMHLHGLKGQDLRFIKAPTTIFSGEDDEIFIAHKYQEVVDSYNKKINIVLVPKIKHIAVMSQPSIQDAICDFIVKYIS